MKKANHEDRKDLKENYYLRGLCGLRGSKKAADGAICVLFF
jgi:hypothetical protein